MVQVTSFHESKSDDLIIISKTNIQINFPLSCQNNDFTVYRLHTFGRKLKNSYTQGIRQWGELTL